MYDQFHLVLLVNHACNLRCTYCYTGDKFSRIMPTDIAHAAIDRAIRSIRPGGTFELGFFGGEPLIEAELIASLLQYAEAQTTAHHFRLVTGLTTNGTIAGEIAWSVMTHKGLHLAVSHDGLPRAHDRHRLTIAGQSTSATVEITLRRLVEAGRDFSVVTVVRPDNVQDLADGIAYLKQLGVRRINPSLDLWTEWTTSDIDRLETTIEKCARVWAEGLPACSINWFDEKAAQLMRVTCDETARCAYGAGQIAVAPSGNLYPCERVVGTDSSDNPSRLGGHALRGDDFVHGFQSVPSRHHEECDSCEMKNLCNTTCRCSNLIRSGDVCTPDELLCRWNQACLTATAEALASMAPV